MNDYKKLKLQAKPKDLKNWETVTRIDWNREGEMMYIYTNRSLYLSKSVELKRIKND